jgi:hypothetical protein
MAGQAFMDSPLPSLGAVRAEQARKTTAIPPLTQPSLAQEEERPVGIYDQPPEVLDGPRKRVRSQRVEQYGEHCHLCHRHFEAFMVI